MSEEIEWVEAYLDGSLSADQERRLAEWLHASPDHLRYFVRETHLHSQLRDLLLAREAVAGPAPAGLEPSGAIRRTCTGFDWMRAWWGRHPLPASVIALGLAVLAAITWWAGPNRSTHSPREIGRVLSIVGIPTLQPSGGTQVELTTAAPVRFGDRLQTGDADRAEIQFHDDTTLRLAFNTIVELPTVERTPGLEANALLRPPEVRLLKGQVWTQVAKRTNAPPYAIRTDAATAIARGTEFGVRLQRLEPTPTNAPSATRQTPFATVLTVKEGAVDFVNAFGSVQATAMTESTARADSAPTEPRRLPTLPTVGLDRDQAWPILTARLTGSVAAGRLVPGGGWGGLSLLDLTNSASVNEPPSDPALQVRVAGIEGGSPADLAGIRPGDRVLSVNGQFVARAGDLERLVLCSPATRLTLRLRRDGEEVLAEAVLARHSSHVPGPALTRRQLEQLADATHRLLTGDASVAERDIGYLRDSVVRAAAENNLGVRWETEDLLGPAIRAYGRAVRADPTVPLYRVNLGLALRLIGSYERAAEELGEAVRLAPASTLARLRFAEIQSLLGRESHALALTEAALEEDPESHGLWELKAQLLWRQHRLQEARDAASRAIELQRNCPVAHAYLGGVLQEEGQVEAAARAYQETLRLAPFEPSIHFRLGQVCRERSEPQKAEHHFQRAAALRPDFADAHLQLGLVLTGRGNLAEAERVLRRARDLVPDSSEIESNLGEVLRHLGRSDEALRCFQRAIDLDPENTAPLNNLGILHAMRREFADAERAFRTVAERDPSQRTTALLNLAMALASQHKLDDAESAYRQALTTDPNAAMVGNHFAFFLAEQRRHLDEALDLARRAVEATPDNPGFLDTLGWVLAQRGEFDAAEQTLNRALQLGGAGPDGPEIRDHLRRVRERKTRLPAQSDQP